MKTQNIIRGILAAESVFLVPLMAMVFSIGGWDWHLPDFIIVGALLAGVGVGCQMIITGVKNNSKLVAIGIILTALMILAWMELAVGIFGTPFAGS